MQIMWFVEVSLLCGEISSVKNIFKCWSFNSEKISSKLHLKFNLRKVVVVVVVVVAVEVEIYFLLDHVMSFV